MIAGVIYALCAASVAAAGPQWIGETFSAASTGNSVNINQLNAQADIVDQLSSLPIGQETITSNTFRCIPGGANCLFLTSLSSNGQAASFLYNVSDTSGKEVGRSVLGLVEARTLHVDKATGQIFSLAVTNAGQGAAVITNGGEIAVDLTQFYTPGASLKSTQCSNLQVMWAGITNGTAGGTLVTISLSTLPARILATQRLNITFDAMWAYCNDAINKDVVGGTVVTPDGSTLQYGTISPAGNFVPTTTVAIPAGYAPSGLLSMPDDYDFFAALYPIGSGPASATGGYIAQWNEGDASMVLSPISYYLTGAARYM